MHPIAGLQLIMMVEEDLDRIRRGEEPWIEYIWRGRRHDVAHLMAGTEQAQVLCQACGRMEETVELLNMRPCRSTRSGSTPEGWDGEIQTT